MRGMWYRTGLWLGGLLVMGIGTMPPAQAHYLWIEAEKQAEAPAAPGVNVYYGEYEEGLREKAGGRLDEVRTLEGLSPLTFEKQQNHFAASLSAAAGALIQVQELDRPVQDWRQYGIGVVKPRFYASALVPGGKMPAPGDSAARTTLGIYPVAGEAPLELVVFFQGQPLARAKVQAHAPNQWSKELKTDEAGRCRFTPPWPGQYVFEVIHLEKIPGTFQEVAYEAVRHRATFTWIARQ